MSSRIF